QRVDNLWTRRLPSRIANWLMAKLSGVSLHDFGTTFKAYRAPVIKHIRLYGDLHRFIPALASWAGARIAEVPIANIPRPQNQSHYGLSRIYMDGRRRRIYTVAPAESRLQKQWSGPRPVPVPARSGVLQ